MKGKTVKCDGSYGLHSYILLPIPENPPTIVDRWGNEWLYLGDTDEEFNRVAKADKNGLVDIATLGHTLPAITNSSGSCTQVVFSNGY